MKYGRYRIVKELGRGAMGVVYQAHDPRIDRHIALKVLRQDHVATEDFMLRFIKEAKAIGRLSHPNIVTVYDVGQDHGTIFIAMELLEGIPLNEMITEDKLSFEKILLLAAQIAGALHYAHQRGIIHRDIKPTNILVTEEDQVKITDFGVARFEDPSVSHQTQAGTIIGTPSYMSAEQVLGKNIDRRTDLYSLGVILYELCTGHMPFKGNNISAVFMAITREIPVEAVKQNASIPSPLSNLIMKSLSRKPEKRFQTGQEMQEALIQCLHAVESTQVSDKTVPWNGYGSEIFSTIMDNPIRKKIAAGLLALLMISLSGGAVYWGSEMLPILFTDGLFDNTPASIEEKKTAKLRVTTLPEGARIFIGGKLKGNSPLSVALEPGLIQVRVSLSEHYEWEAPLELKGEKEIPLFVRLMPINQ